MSELSGSLLQVLTHEDRTKRPNATPLMMEFPVNPELEPFLVSSSKATLWVRSYGGRVRAATRKVPELTTYFWEVVQAAVLRGRQESWGNVHPLTKAGLQAAIEHVRSYDLPDLEILANPETKWADINSEWAVEGRTIPMALLGLPLQPATWLPPHTLVVVPRDRSFVGFVLLFHEHLASVVHNAGRGLGIATSWEAS